MIKKILLIFSFFIASIWLFSHQALAASYSLSPSGSSIQNGNEFTVTIGLNTDSKEVNQVEAALSFSNDKLQYQDVSFTNIFPWTNKSSSGNIIRLSGGENTGFDFFTGNQNWATIRFKAIAPGTAQLSFRALESSILERSTLANLLDTNNLPQGNFTITDTDVPTTPPTVAPTNPPDNNNNNDSGGGSSGGDGGGSGSGCGDAQPNTVLNLRATTGLSNGEVALVWDRAPGADNYWIAFGEKSGQYLYGSGPIGNTNQYTVKSMTPGKLYYFVVAAKHGCASSGFSNEASARAKGSIATGGTVVTPKGKATPTPNYVQLAPPDFRPIGEVLPGADVDTTQMTPTPIPTVMPKEIVKSIPDYMLFGIIGILVIIAFAIVTYFISRQHHPNRPGTGSSTGTIRTGPFDNF